MLLLLIEGSRKWTVSGLVNDWPISYEYLSGGPESTNREIIVVLGFFEPKEFMGWIDLQTNKSLPQLQKHTGGAFVKWISLCMVEFVNMRSTLTWTQNIDAVLCIETFHKWRHTELGSIWTSFPPLSHVFARIVCLFHLQRHCSPIFTHESKALVWCCVKCLY